MKVKSKQFGAIDVAKYVSALLVVAIHVYPFLEINEFFNSYFIATVCRLAVPFFFVSSGFFFFRGMQDGEERANKEKLFKYLRRVGILYAVWTVIYIPYTLWNFGSGFSIGAVLGYIRDIFLNGSYYHLWFLPALMWGMSIVFWLLKKQKAYNTLIICLGLYGFGYLLNVWGPVWETIPYVNLGYGFIIKILGTVRDGFFFAPIFLYLGYAATKVSKLKKSRALTAFVVSFILLCLEVWLYFAIGIMRDLSCMFITLIPCAWFLMHWLLSLNLPWKPEYKRMREESTLIYVSHILFARLFLLILPTAHLVVYLATLFCSQTFSDFILWLKLRVPWVKYLF